MLPDKGIIRWLDRQARSGPLLTRSGDLHDLPEALGGNVATFEARDNPMEVDGPRLSEEEYRDSVRTLTADMRDRILAMSTGFGEEALGTLARKVRGLRRQALSGDLFGGFIRENPPLPNARTRVNRDYTKMRENPEDKEMSPRSFQQLVFGVFDNLNDELQSRAEALTKTERGYVIEKLKAARMALPNGERENPNGDEDKQTDEDEKPWWVDEGPENPDRFASRNKAEQRGVLLGCGEEYHEHEQDGETFFMPCDTHEEWQKKTGRDNPSKNFHEAKIRESDDGEYETFRRDDNPEGFERGIQILFGIRPEDEEGPRGGRSEIVSVFYPADEWNAANAQRHAESTFDGFDDFEEATGERENPSAEARTVSLEINYDLEATEATHKEIIQWIRSTVDEFDGEIKWTDSRGPAGAPVSIEVGIEIFGVQDAAVFQQRFESYTEEELPGVASIHTKSVAFADDIAGDPDTVVTVALQYSAQDLPQVDPGDPPENDRFYFDAKSMVKDTLGGWAMGASELATPRTVQFGFPTASEAIRAEAVLKDALEDHPSSRVYLSSVTNESAETSEQENAVLRPNPQTSHAGGDSPLVRVTERTADVGRMESAPEVRSMIDRTADAADGEIVGVSEAPGGTVRDVYVEFDSPTGAEMFTNELNTAFFTRGLSDRALAVQESPSRLAARENPNGGDGAVLRVGIQTGALPEDAPDMLAMVEEAAESEGADITGVRQSDSGESKDFLVTADTTAKAQSIINDLNNRFSTQGIAEAASATLQHEARQNPPAVLRVGINRDRLPEDAPDMLSVVEEAAEAEGGDISGVEQSGSGDVKDFTVSAPTTEKANAIISALNSKFTTLGVAGATTVTLEHEARENPPGHTVRVEIPQSETVYPDDVSPEDLREKVLETASGMGGAVDRQSNEVIEVTFDTTEGAISLQEAVVDDANDMGVSNVFVLRKNMRPRPNPASTVLVRYPSGQSGLESTVRDAAESAGGHVRSVGSAEGSNYSGMKEAEVRFNSEPDAFSGVGKIESAFRSEGVGEFEATTLTEEDVPPVRPNPIFPGGGDSLVSLSSEEPTGSGESAVSLQDEPPEEEGDPASLQSEDPSGPSTSALSIEAREAPAEVVVEARRLGKERGEEDGLPEFANEDEAFRHAVQALPGTGVLRGIDTSTPDGLLALEEAASAWTNGYAEATGSEWPRLNPYAGGGSSSGGGPADTGANSGIEPSHAPARENPEGKKGGREALSYLAMTATLIGGGVFLADSVLTERAQNAPATAIVNE